MVEPHHEPVMVSEVLEGLRADQGGRFIDGTVGEGGHALAILEVATRDTRLLGIDLDSEMLGLARERLSGYSGRIDLVHGSYGDVGPLARDAGFFPADGVLMDLGPSSLHLEEPERGFSFARDGPLDMRFDTGQELTAHEIVNRYPERRLAQIIREYGEERRAGRIARAIFRSRPLETTAELATTVAGAAGRSRRQRLHPATRTFQALRIAVNRELDNVDPGVRGAIDVLRTGGRLVVIAYHSLEDRLVKNALREESSACICPPEAPVCACGHTAKVKLINRRVIKPSREEIGKNPRSRSARIRIAERIPAH